MIYINIIYINMHNSIFLSNCYLDEYTFCKNNDI